MGLTYRGLNVQTANIHLDLPYGIRLPWAVRGSDDIVPGADGREEGAWEDDYLDLILEGWVKGTGATLTDRQQSWRTNTDALRATLLHDLEPGPLLVSGPYLGLTDSEQLDARCVNVLTTAPLASMTFQRWSIVLRVITSTPPTVESVLAYGDSGAGYTRVWHPPAGLTNKYLVVGIGFNGPDWSPTELVNGITWQPDSTNSGTYQSLARLGRVVGANMSMELWGLANPTDEIGSNGRLHAGPGTSSDRTAYCAAWLSGARAAPTVSAGTVGSGTASSDSYSGNPSSLVLNWGSIRLQSPLTAALGLTELAEYQLATASNKISTAMGSEVATGAGIAGWTHSSAEWASMNAVFAGG